jgi:hypothetical protein
VASTTAVDVAGWLASTKVPGRGCRRGGARFLRAGVVVAAHADERGSSQHVAVEVAKQAPDVLPSVALLGTREVW